MLNRNQKSVRQPRGRSQNPTRAVRVSLFAVAVVSLSLLTRHSSLVLGQQPQANDVSSTQPLFNANAKYVQGVGPGYWVTAGTWPNVSVAPGTSFCGNPQAALSYAGGTLPMTAGATNYVYLDPANNCAPASNTNGFAAGQIPLAKVVAGSAAFTSITDLRTWFVSQPLGTDPSGHVEGSRFCDQYFGATPCASAISSAGSNSALIINPPSNSASTEAICGAASAYNGIISLGGTTNGCSNTPNTSVWDFRDGLHVTNYDSPGNSTEENFPNVIIGNQWVGNRYRTSGYTQIMNVVENAFSQKVFDGGLNVNYQPSSPNYFDKRVFQTANISGMYYTPAEHIPLAVEAFSGATGDTIGMEVLSMNYGGASTQGDEGLEAAGFTSEQLSDVYSGTICGSSPCSPLSQGATQITINNQQSEGEQGAGRPLLDISKGSNGTLSSIGTSNLGAWTWSQYVGSGTSWTPNTVLALTDGAIPGPNCNPSTALPAICTVTPASYTIGSNLGGVTASTPIIIADNGSYEVVKASGFSGSPQNAFTATFTKPHPPGAVVSIANGGACASGSAGTCAGYYLELLSDRYGAGGYSSTCGVSPAVNCIRQAFPILAVTDNSHLIPWAVGNNGIGYGGHGIAGSCSPPTCTAWQQSNQYFSYPGAEVLSWQQGGKLSDTATLAPNAVNWASGDLAENQHYWHVGTSANVSSSVQRYLTYVGGGSGSGLAIHLNGHGWRWNDDAIMATDWNDPSEYPDYVAGAPFRPPAVIETDGLFSFGLYMPIAPSTYGGAAISIGCPATQVSNGTAVNMNPNCAATRPVNDIVNYDLAGADLISLNPSTSQFVLTAAGGAQSYTFGANTLSVPGGVTSAGAMSLSAGGTNQNVTLTPSGTGAVTARNFATSLNVVNYSATPTFDASLGNTQKITLTGNLTSSTLANAAAGQQLNFIICQDSTGSRMFAWPSNVKGGMTIGTTASKCSAQSFVFDGANAEAVSSGVSNM